MPTRFLSPFYLLNVIVVLLYAWPRLWLVHGGAHSDGMRWSHVGQSTFFEMVRTAPTRQARRSNAGHIRAGG